MYDLDSFIDEPMSNDDIFDVVAELDRKLVQALAADDDETVYQLESKIKKLESKYKEEKFE